MRSSDRLKMAALKSKSKILMDPYRQARNKVNSLNIQFKRRYSSAKISKCKGNMKESWKTIDELLNKRSKSCGIDCLKDSDHTFVNKKAISNAMNNFFCTIGEKLASKIYEVPSPLLSDEATKNNSSVKLQIGSITKNRSVNKSKLLRTLGKTTFIATS